MRSGARDAGRTWHSPDPAWFWSIRLRPAGSKGSPHLLVDDLRTQVYQPEVFEQMGIRLAEKRLVVVKPTFHFYAPFRAIASRVI
ncbi:MlrC C-terminal domain-containing protein [Roseovarius sp. S4756]|uniref:MlrC C-terminal domain-containing protein n=1 Tax=Roseovarius maritimus TaxID=3342637 RepID=UPI0037266109